MERRLLQAAVLLGGFVPVIAGAAGMLQGGAMVPGPTVDISLDSHIRYLSGLLFGIGIVFWASIPTIERRTTRVRLLTAIIVCGGLARLYGAIRMGLPDIGMRFGLAMELVVTPVLCLWQARVARRSARPR